MAKVRINTPAPDFELEDFDGKTVRLSDFRGQKHVVLVFNRGFI
jgi:peroxiredoxin